ncbi:hypothetical protein PoB_000478400 [Plakobranchus ocellatus]|uniref:Uncharacterized protein n=1 Tax=Plakobranchus ocellatus TaxID=259542 RepID=A0AAV3Y880_9GAST|nr:hypothetical protein PoB_000478400 [Plakobranchus ocellatus]
MCQFFNQPLHIVTLIAVIMLTTKSHAKVAEPETELWTYYMIRSETDLRSSEAETMTVHARIFSRRSNNNITACLCVNGPSALGWCYLGEAENGQEKVVNVSFEKPGLQSNLTCQFYVTVGKSYLYCNSLLVNGTKNCPSLQACISKETVLVCPTDGPCVAWCDINGTFKLLGNNASQSDGEVKAPAKVTHHLGHDVIGVMAGAGVLGLLCIACCVVDKVRNSTYWILRHPKKRKEEIRHLSTGTWSSTGPPTRSSISSEPTFVLGQGIPIYMHPKKKQPRSTSLPTITELCNVSTLCTTASCNDIDDNVAHTDIGENNEAGNNDARDNYQDKL